MNLPPLPEPWADSAQGWAYTGDQLQAYATKARADMVVENERLRKIAWLIGSIYAHGNFKAETYNESELEKLLRENGTFWKTPEEFSAALTGDKHVDR